MAPSRPLHMLQTLLLLLAALLATTASAAGGRSMLISEWAEEHPNYTRPSAASSVDVIVIGAGYSGLSAARSLAREGYSVAVVEARERIGGRSYRIQAVPPAAKAPIWVDEGGQWVGPTQTLFLDLLKQYNLTLYDSYHGLGKISIHWNNQTSAQAGACWDCMVFPVEGDEESAKPLEDATKAATTRGGLRKGMSELMRVMKEFRKIVATINIDEPWLTPNATALDGISFEQWVHATTKNELARDMLVLAGSELGAIAEPWWSSALHIFRQQAASPQVDTPEKWLIKGAAGQVPTLLAEDVEAAGGKIFRDSPVSRIEQDTTGVTIFAGDNALQIEGKAVIVAMPPHLAGRIDYLPPLSAARDQLTQRTFMGSIIKCVIVYDSPWWRKNKATNESFIFYPQGAGIMTTAFDVTQPEEIGGGGSGVLASFITMENTFHMTDKEREEAVLQGLAQIFKSDLALKPTAFIQKNWAEEPYTGGAYSAVMPVGAWTTYGEAWSAPVGKVFWAGTEVSNRWPGFYEGALHSANVAVEGVKKIVQPSGKYTGPLFKVNPANMG